MAQVLLITVTWLLNYTGRKKCMLIWLLKIACSQGDVQRDPWREIL